MMHQKVVDLLRLAVANKASDVHLAVNSVPKIRIHGILTDVGNFENNDPALMTEMILSLCGEEDQKKKIVENRDLDFSVSFEESRFRANMFYEKGQLACALRVVPNIIPALADLNLPDNIKTFITQKQGFVLVTGPTGQGKSTTVASLLNEINHTQPCHLVTIEDPIEYVIKPERALVSQREVPYDTLTFPNALKSVLRQDPNVVFVGEMRDLETISSALTIAETGHLVFSTLHTNSAAQTIERIIDVFPEGTKGQIRMQLSSVLTAVISQRLIPTVDGARVPALEILVATPAVKNAIREGKTFMVDNIIQTSADAGMISMDTYLARLIKAGKVSEEIAMQYSLKPDELHNRLRSEKLGR
jgi:twitching motility protein PilT